MKSFYQLIADRFLSVLNNVKPANVFVRTRKNGVCGMRLSTQIKIALMFGIITIFIACCPSAFCSGSIPNSALQVTIDGQTISNGGTNVTGTSVGLNSSNSGSILAQDLGEYDNGSITVVCTDNGNTFATWSVTGLNGSPRTSSGSITWNPTTAGSHILMCSGTWTGGTVNGTVNTSQLTVSVVSTPTITSLSPASGVVGASVNITGTNFGSSQGSSTLTFNGVAATTISSWGTNSGTSIVVQVPANATSGNVVVSVSGVASNGVDFTVLKSQNITFTAPSTPVTYGVSPITLNATASSGLSVNFNVVFGPATISGTTLTLTGTGTVVIAANQSGNSTYGAAPQVTQSIVVNKAALTITASSPSVAYGAAVPTITPIYSGWVNGQSSSSLTTQPTCSTPYTTSSTAGSSPTTSCTGAASTNYSISYVNGVVAVSKATPLLTWATPASVLNGSILSSVQLNATANVAGSQFVYTPNSGTVLTEGTQTLSVTFTPSDQVDYTTATASVSLKVWAAPAIGIITTVAGNGVNGYAGDNASAINAELNSPKNVAVDSSGNIYIADTLNNVVRIVSSSTGVISTYAGNSNGTSGSSGDGGAATSAYLSSPSGVAVDGAGNVYIADTGNYVIRKVSTSGLISLYAGTYKYGNSGNGSAATSATFEGPISLALDSSGNLYIADSTANCIREINPSTGIIANVAGNGTAGFSGDGGLAVNAQLNTPKGVAVDSSGNIYISDNFNGLIREVAASNGSINTIVGITGSYGSIGDGGPAIEAQIGLPIGIVFDASGNISFSGDNSVIRHIQASNGIISTIAGNGTAGYSGDGGPATSAELAGPYGLALDPSGNIYLADATSRIRVVSIKPLIWATPAPITYGTPLSSTQLNATSTIPGGTISYSPALGTILSAGTQTLTATFTPSGQIDFGTFTTTVQLVVNQATPVITWPTPAPINNQTPISATQLDATFNTAGTPQYSLATGTVLSPGPHVIGVTFTPTDSIDYTDAVAEVTLMVNKASTTKSDSGTITLTVGGVTAATTSYGAGATPSTIASGLAAGVQPGSFVSITAVENNLYLESTQAGSGTNYSYSLATTSYDATDFSQPSFVYPAISGMLEGGANANTTGATVYSYTVNNYDNVGNIGSITDSVMGTWTYNYDSLNRLDGATANQSGNPNTNYCWAYDAFGNRLIQAASNAAFVDGATSSTPCVAASSASYSSQWAEQSPLNNNQLAATSQSPSGVEYDAAGNMINDGVNQYLYDGEGRVCAVANSPIPSVTTLTGYIYDADGIRVAKGTITSWSCDPSVNGFSTTNDYVLGPGGEQMSEYAMDANNTLAWQHTNVWAGGALIATYDNDGLHFYLDDPLGTRRAQTDYAGVLEQTCQSLPFGDGLSCSGGDLSAPTEHHFTGKERDSESGNDYFGARYYASSMGRFLSADSSGYSGLTNPQSWNLYAYSLNNPLRYIDPSGHTVECATNAADCLAAAQAAVGKTAAAQLTTQTTTTQNWFQKIFGLSTTTTTLQITGNEADFRAASGNASKLADLIDSKTNIPVYIQQDATMHHPGALGWMSDSGWNMMGGAQTMLPSQGLIPEVYLDPGFAMVPGNRQDEDRDHIPPANIGEKFAHELLGHMWGELFGGHRGGTVKNKRDSINSENEVRRTDPSRGQKTKHHDE